MIVCGVDEAGRGCLFGEVVAAAVVLDANHPITGLNDSKALTPAIREQQYQLIRRHAKACAVGYASVAEIDHYNILQASLMAMGRAVQQLTCQPDLVLVDGNQAPAMAYPVRTVIKGDRLHANISAASIVAKGRARSVDAPMA